ncbi:MAG: aminoacyl-tRNA hydrolase [Clostridia bacterium]|nr:aminoacyl-tRNA hydrolase [Clostridia bacterium]
MIAIVGLGNIGAMYEKTYHNMGFVAVSRFAQKNGFTFSKSKYSASVAEGVYNGEKVVILKPSTFMNASGQSVKQVVKMLKLDLKEILVVYDDIDLPCGNIRVRQSGSAGTHNGMRSIVEHLGSTDFPRLRIGIGRDERMNLADYVLSRVSEQNSQLLEPAFDKAVDIIEQFIKCKGDVNKIKVN